MLLNYTNEGERGRRINHTRELHEHPLGGYLEKQCIFFKLCNCRLQKMHAEQMHFVFLSLQILLILV